MASGTKALSVLAALWLAGRMCASLVPPALGPWLALGSLGIGSLLAFAGVSASQAPPPPVRQVRHAASAVLALCALASGAAVLPPSPAELPAAGLASLEVLVLHTRLASDDRPEAFVRVLRGRRLEDGARVRTGTVLLASPIEPTLAPAGARVRLLAKLHPSRAPRNPTPHPSWPAAYASAGRAWIASIEGSEQSLLSAVRAALEAVRASVRERLSSSLPARTAEIARALVLGDGQALEEDAQLAIRESGLTHVLAVSGLHVTLAAGALVGCLTWLLGRVPSIARRYEPHRLACVLGAPLCFVYAAFAGGAPSALRAATTAALAWMLVALGRRPQPIAVTALAVLAMGALDPEQALRPGFLLSVAATAAILAQPKAGSDLRSVLLVLARISLATTLATAPIVIWCFGKLPIASLLANLVLLPLGSFVLLPLANLHALSAAFDLVPTITALPLIVASDAFVAGCTGFAKVLPAITLPPPTVAQAVVLSACVLALGLLRSQRARLGSALAGLVLIGVLELGLRSEHAPLGLLRATFLDVGQGDACLIDLPNGQLLLIDAGGNPSGGPDPGSRVLAPLLAARRRDRVDLAVLSHPHPDHYGGLRAVAESVPIDELWDTGQAEAERELPQAPTDAIDLLAWLRTKGTRVRTPRELCGRSRDAGGAVLRVLAPCPTHDSGYGENDNSLIVRIDHGARSFLFLGDAETHQESKLAHSRAKLRADVLKVAHHGSRTSSTDALLAAVRPSLAIVSAGAGNRFGHPHAEVMERLYRHGTRVLHLADTGGTIVTSDGKSLRVEPLIARGEAATRTRFTGQGAIGFSYTR